MLFSYCINTFRWLLVEARQTFSQYRFFYQLSVHIRVALISLTALRLYWIRRSQAAPPARLVCHQCLEAERRASTTFNEGSRTRAALTSEQATRTPSLGNCRPLNSGRCWLQLKRSSEDVVRWTSPYERRAVIGRRLPVWSFGRRFCWSLHKGKTIRM